MMRKLKIIILENIMLTLSTFIAILTYIYVILYNNKPLSGGFWTIIILIIFLTIGSILSSLARRSVIRRDDFPQKEKERYRETERKNISRDYMRLFVFLFNLPCWYFLEASPFLYLWGFFLVFSFFPQKILRQIFSNFL